MLSALFFFYCQEIQETLVVRRVELDARVFNLAQAPVTGLDRSAFSIKESGKDMELVGFEEVNYLEMIPSETFDAPRVLFLFNFLDDSRLVTDYIREAEDFFLYKELGAWQVAVGYANLDGVFMVSPFSTDQDSWIEGINAVRTAHQNFDQRSLFSRKTDRFAQDASRRSSTDYGFEENPNLRPNSEGLGIQSNSLGQDVERYVGAENPALNFDPRALSRFIRLLSTYYGIKEVLVFGNPLWQRSERETQSLANSRGGNDGPVVESYYAKSNATGTLSDASGEMGFDLNETLTRCVKDRIRFSRMAFSEPGTPVEDEFVSMCGGFLYPTTRTGISDNVERYLTQAGHFYRLAYQTEMEKSDLHYRKVRVDVKGLGLSVVHVGRFYPALLETENQLSAGLDVKPIAQVHFGLPWDRLSYEKVGVEMRGQIGLGKRVFFNQRLVFEQVDVLQPIKPSSEKTTFTNMSGSQFTVDMDLPVFEEGHYRVEFVAIDLLTGMSAQLKKNIDL
ncbi:MAG: hypothetical protein H6510_17235 [Acidobacteria bacterium]|nr:hypothetical protein [Acidobacteriota bacterium]MCB9399559.1 hypothetical protein [Acidobacteriota bacterium]